MPFKGARGGSGWVDWGKVDTAPTEVIEGIKANLPHILSQMPWNEQLELLGSYHTKTTDVATIKADIAKAMAKEGLTTTDEVTAVRAEVNEVLGLLRTNCPKWFK